MKEGTIMKKISRRSFLMATGTFAAATALTACSGGGSTGKANTTASSAAASAASEAADQIGRAHV